MSAGNESSTENPKAAGASRDDNGKRNGPPRRVLVIGLLLFAAAGAVGVFSYVRSRAFEHTDDAFVEAHVVQIASRIDAYLAELAVEDNQEVKAGQVLVKLDGREQEAALETAKAAVAVAEARLQLERTNVELMKSTTTAALAKAKAGVASAEAHLASAGSGVSQAQSQEAALAARLAQSQSAVAAAQSDADRTEAELKRYTDLQKSGAISPSQFDTAHTAADMARARLEEANKEVAAQEAAIAAAAEATKVSRNLVGEADSAVASAKAVMLDAEAAPQRIAAAEATATQAEGELARAKAQLANAEVQLDYTTIRAPFDGRVTKRQAERGTHVQKGQALLAIVGTERWVAANFKETQLSDMRAGQPVTVHVDAFPGHDLRGRVDSIQAGTGSRFSLLPPENATGNYIKVVQRVPVKIIFEDDAAKDLPLAPGMSVVPSVKVR